jgi:HEAT repeat protein
MISLEDRLLDYAELVAAKAQLAADDLVMRLRDGRATVRANAALGLAALGHGGRELVPLVRDGDPQVALAVAQALVHLGRAQREHLAAIAAALEDARPEVVETIEKMFAELVGTADAELASLLDTSSDVIATAVVRACERVGVRGLHVVQAAARDPRVRVRINAVRGIARFGDLEFESSVAVLTQVERDDDVSDVRAATRVAIGVLAARSRAAATRLSAQAAVPTVPELELRELKPDELRAAAGVAPIAELLHALGAARIHARVNAVRVLALKGTAAAPSARVVSALLRDEEVSVRIEVAQALGTIGADAAAPALVRALDDAAPAVIAAAEASLAAIGEAAAPALLHGLDTPSEPHGARIAALLAKLPDGPQLLRDALASTSVDVRVHAALGLAAIGKARAGAAAATAIARAAVGGNARLRAVAMKAIATLEPRHEAAPRIAIDGFEDRVLGEPELAKAKAVLAAAGAAGVAAHLADARAAVRANAVTALAVIGGDAQVVAQLVAVCLRDDAAEVRLATSRALDRLGDAAVAARAHDLVRALVDGDAALATQIAAMLRSRAHPTIDAALGHALDFVDPSDARPICELVCERPGGVDILCAAFERPGAAVNAARGFVMLGKDRLGKGRAVLEAARGGSSLVMRDVAHAALRAIDGAPAAPALPAVATFETALLDANAFKGADLDARALELALLHDGRAIVRANLATALGALGAAATPFATVIGALLRDADDRVRVAAASALDKIGDDAVVAAASFLVGGLAGDKRVADVCRTVLAARKSKVEAALVAGLETADEVHGTRICELICALPNARELLFAAFDGPAQNVQVNALLGIGMLGAKKAGAAGRQRLQRGLAGPLTRRYHAAVKALAMLGPESAS